MKPFLATLIRRYPQTSNNIKSARSDSEKSIHRFQLWKLGLNVATFSIWQSFYIIFTVFLLIQDRCFSFRTKMPVQQIYGLLRYCDYYDFFDFDKRSPQVPHL